MSNLELLAAAFSATLGVEVVTPETGARLGLPKVSVHELFHHTYTMRPGPIESVAPGEEFEINVKTLTGAGISFNVSSESTIAEVKSAVQLKADDIPPQHQSRLVFNSKTLLDHQSVCSLGIPPGGVMFFGGISYTLDTDDLDPSFDYDFTHMKPDGNKYMRGGFEYWRPYGWNRFALKVLSKKEYGDDTWLGPNGIRTESASGEWPVSYHGTGMENVKGIYEKGYYIGPRKNYGRGVYSSPSLDMVEKIYAKKFDYKGKTYKVVMQNRVNPNRSDGSLDIRPASETGVGADYWISPLQNPKRGIYDVRPYGVLIKQV